MNRQMLMLLSIAVVIAACAAPRANVAGFGRPVAQQPAGNIP
jgi:hypothetical protein